MLSIVVIDKTLLRRTVDVLSTLHQQLEHLVSNAIQHKADRINGRGQLLPFNTV